MTTVKPFSWFGSARVLSQLSRAGLPHEKRETSCRAFKASGSESGKDRSLGFLSTRLPRSLALEQLDEFGHGRPRRGDRRHEGGETLRAHADERDLHDNFLGRLYRAFPLVIRARPATQIGRAVDYGDVGLGQSHRQSMLLLLRAACHRIRP